MQGLLLINLGTPDAPTPRAVRRYLREFLSDPMVLDMNPVGRWLLLNLMILPFRPKKSAAAYQLVWTDRGSPLMFHSEDLAAGVRERLGSGWHVELAMRYGTPSIEAAFERFRAAGVEHVITLALFPQSAASSTGTALRFAARLADQPPPVRLTAIEDFYDAPGFIAAFAAVGRPILDAEPWDHVVFSFHGLPERHVTRADPTGSHCLASDDCCGRITDQSRHCYRAQAYATARAIAAALRLDQDSFTVSFQSRLGRIPWIRPYTDELIDELAAQGKKHLVVFCPAFVADCLETLEEIGMRARDQFVAAGGESLVLVPSLNSDAAWVDAVAELARSAAPEEAS